MSRKGVVGRVAKGERGVVMAIRGNKEMGKGSARVGEGVARLG